MSITSANSTGICIITDIFPAGFKMEKYSADAMFQQEARQMAETRISPDDQMAAGWVPNLKQLTLSLEADSPTLPYFESLVSLQDTIKEWLQVSMTFTVPSIGRIYQYTQGVLYTANDIANAERVLAPRQFVFHFGMFECLPYQLV